jgi:4-diphosphocytidyl-2-C-methyl-D-erythritol kinase
MTRRFAPAKLNLYLHVTGKRADGYHLLDSLVAFASIGDEVIATPAETLTLRVTGPFAASLSDPPNWNLAWRAAEALARKLGRSPRVALQLVKNLPVVSGVGGGSSDAAACLRALAELWECDDEAMLMQIAAALGSDVPACLAARPVWLGGVGERIESAGKLPPCGVLLVNPRLPLPTNAVYQAYRGGASAPGRFAIPADTAAFAVELSARRNDLAGAAMRLMPAIGEILEQLGALDGALLARMSGSGATCFALFASAREADAASEPLRKLRPEWWIAAGELLAASPAA